MRYPKLPAWLTLASGIKFTHPHMPYMPLPAPACFRNQDDWNVYRYICDWLRHRRKIAQSWDFCRDCTPEYRDAMHAAGRCAYPGTIFKRVNSIIVGRRPH